LRDRQVATVMEIAQLVLSKFKKKLIVQLPIELEGHSVERMYGLPPTKVFRLLTASVNKTIVKLRVAAATDTYTSDFPYVKFHVPALTR